MKGNLNQQYYCHLDPNQNLTILKPLLLVNNFLVKEWDILQENEKTVTNKTKITAAPNPTAVLTVFETAKYEHIPKKYAKIIFSEKIALIKISNVLSIIYLSLLIIFY